MQTIGWMLPGPSVVFSSTPVNSEPVGLRRAIITVRCNVSGLRRDGVFVN